ASSQEVSREKQHFSWSKEKCTNKDTFRCLIAIWRSLDKGTFFTCFDCSSKLACANPTHFDSMGHKCISNTF
ncbi:hypothetical protein RFY08_17895, partial [Acinetobacter baumannii]|nr:hypothetical protein [Acinetobacter baumannii]